MFFTGFGDRRGNDKAESCAAGQAQLLSLCFCPVDKVTHSLLWLPTAL